MSAPREAIVLCRESLQAFQPIASQESPQDRFAECLCVYGQTRNPLYGIRHDLIAQAAELTHSYQVFAKDAEASIEITLRQRKKIERAVSEGEEILAAIRGGEAIENVAARFGVELRDTGPFTRQDFVPSLGRQNAAIGAAFGLNEGEVSSVVEANNNVLIIEQIGFTPADSITWDQQVVSQRLFVTQSLRQTRLEQWLSGVRAAAKIVDLRDAVLRGPVDDNPNQIQTPVF